jgi:hypothetical protein
VTFVSALFRETISGAGPTHDLAGGLRPVKRVQEDVETPGMDDVLIPGADGQRRALQQLVAVGGAPAFVVRALRVQEAFDSLLARCRRQRLEWLEVARMRIGVLHALTGDWAVVRILLQDEEQVEMLRQLHAELRPELRLPPPPTTAPRIWRRALLELIDSLERFNLRWSAYLGEVDLGPINELRDAYNRFYVLEKECLLGSPRLARQGFRPLPPLHSGDLAVLLPPLPVPSLR